MIIGDVVERLTRSADESKPRSARKAPASPPPCDISVIVWISRGSVALRPLYEEYSDAIRSAGYTFEFLFVAEDPLEYLDDAVMSLSDGGEPVKLFRQRERGASLLRRAARETRGAIVLTLPTEYCVEPGSVIRLIHAVEEGRDLAVARRWPRRDPWFNRLQNRVFHLLLGPMVGGPAFHDILSGICALRRDVMLDLPVYGNSFRFLPILARNEGYQAEEVCLPQDPRNCRARLQAPRAYLGHFLDVIGMYFIIRFTEKPLRFFGAVGMVSILTGGAMLAMLFVQRIAGAGIADRPLLLLAVLLLVLGINAVALGLVGEIIVHAHASSRPSYRLFRERGSSLAPESRVAPEGNRRREEPGNDPVEDPRTPSIQSSG